MELWLIRHGQTSDNTLRILAGHQPGKLSDLGIEQAIKTGKRLSCESFTEIYCSDLGRAKETLDNILFSFPDSKEKSNVTYLELLREKNTGVLEGKTLAIWKECSEKAGLGIRRFKPENGESWVDVYDRAEQFLDLLIEKYMKSSTKDEMAKSILESDDIEERKIESLAHEKLLPINKGKNDMNIKGIPKVLVVTHGGFIMEFFNVVNFRKSNQRPIFLNDTKNCSINRIRVYQKPGEDRIVYEIKEKNAINHLE